MTIRAVPHPPSLAPLGAIASNVVIELRPCPGRRRPVLALRERPVDGLFTATI
jgi:hypothetical protein